MDCVQYAGRCIPADAVGGDYFGYFPRGVSGVDSLVGDVSGHGVGAALLMAEARTMFLAERLVAPSACQLLAKLNELLHDDLDRAGLLHHRLLRDFRCADARAQLRQCRTSARSPAARRRDALHDADAEGALLGISKDVDFADVKVKLQTGDIVVFYTDGITEAQNGAGEMFGIERLGEAVTVQSRRRSRGTGRWRSRGAGGFAGGTPHEDDLTIVVMKLAA